MLATMQPMMSKHPTPSAGLLAAFPTGWWRAWLRALRPSLLPAGADLGLPPLARGATQRHEARAGDELRVLAGRVWVTQSGGSDDHLLAEGERLNLAHAGRVVIEGDSDQPARVCWQPGRP